MFLGLEGFKAQMQFRYRCCWLWYPAFGLATMNDDLGRADKFEFGDSFYATIWFPALKDEYPELVTNPAAFQEHLTAIERSMILWLEFGMRVQEYTADTREAKRFEAVHGLMRQAMLRLHRRLLPHYWKGSRTPNVVDKDRTATLAALEPITEQTLLQGHTSPMPLWINDAIYLHFATWRKDRQDYGRD